MRLQERQHRHRSPKARVLVSMGREPIGSLCLTRTLGCINPTWLSVRYGQGVWTWGFCGKHPGILETRCHNTTSGCATCATTTIPSPFPFFDSRCHSQIMEAVLAARLVCRMAQSCLLASITSHPACVNCNQLQLTQAALASWPIPLLKDTHQRLCATS